MGKDYFINNQKHHAIMYAILQLVSCTQRVFEHNNK